uniref:Uncharacterized protein n=1 Tax=Arundo donax TaxID=35708 RepID=A0A0A8ZG65_ARUDO
MEGGASTGTEGRQIAVEGRCGQHWEV